MRSSSSLPRIPCPVLRHRSHRKSWSEGRSGPVPFFRETFSPGIRRRSSAGWIFPDQERVLPHQASLPGGQQGFRPGPRPLSRKTVRSYGRTGHCITESIIPIHCFIRFIFSTSLGTRVVSSSPPVLCSKTLILREIQIKRALTSLFDIMSATKPSLYKGDNARGHYTIFS